MNRFPAPDAAPEATLQATRGAIIDAAERVFAQKGYDGAGLREVALVAGVNLGLINYYFGSKDRLFVATVGRRFKDLRTRVANSVQHAPTGETEAILRAFLRPILHCAGSEGEGWRDYLTLLARGMRAYRQQDVAETLHGLAAISDILRDALTHAFGLANGMTLALPCYFLEAAIIYMTQDEGLLDLRTQGQHTADRLATIEDEMVRFFAAGFEACRPRHNLAL